MIYRFSRQSGGTARIYPELGVGTTVCIYLPRYHGDVPEPAAEPSRALRDGETVLIVDDEPKVRMLVAEVLDDLGYTTMKQRSVRPV